jgi:translation elongation factor EF-1beta
MEGLEWKACKNSFAFVPFIYILILAKLVAIGYGISKLQISCHVEDDKVSVDDIQEKIGSFEDLVQSTDISSFTKL